MSVHSLRCSCFLSIDFSTQLAYYGVFDGHAGPKASQFAAQRLHEVIADRFPKGVCVNIAMLVGG